METSEKLPSFADAIISIGNEYSPAAFWFLYGELDKGEMERQLSEMVDKGVRQGFLHPRAYLTTPYLEDAWWDVIGHAVEHARKIGFSPWLYDEYAWPSGTAGSTFKYSSQKPSRVLAAGSAHMAKSLVPEVIVTDRERDAAAILTETAEGAPYCAVAYRATEDGRIEAASLRVVSLTGSADGEATRLTPGDRLMVFRLKVHELAVDYLNPEAIRAFIACTHEEYAARYGADFGSLIPGIFFDEIFNAGSPVVWTEGFREEFQRRRGYDPLPRLPLLILEGDAGTAEFRRDYYGVVAELYEAAFFAPLGEWCARHGLVLTGHTEEWIAEHPLRQGDYFRTLRHLQMPGADCHDYRYRYPRLISPVEPKGAVSVARLAGRPRVLSEALGGGGWAAPLQEFKRGVNVLAAMGINFFVLHGFAYETDHQGSQADWPASFFFQNPYWRHFKLFSTYIARLSLLGSLGKPVVRVGILYPIASMRERFRNGAASPEGKVLAERYNRVLEELVRNQIDADLLDEETVLTAAIADATLSAGQEAFRLIAVPGASGLSEAAVEKLKTFEKAGGRILVYDAGDAAGMEAVSSTFAAPLCAGDPGTDGGRELAAMVRAAAGADFTVLGQPQRDVFYYRREYRGHPFYLVVNGSPRPASFTAAFAAEGTPFRLDLENGEIAQFPGGRSEGGRTTLSLDLGPDEAVCVFFEAEGAISGPERSAKEGSRPTPAPLEPIVVDLPAEAWLMKPLPPEPLGVPRDRAWSANEPPLPKADAVLMEIAHADFRTSLAPQWERIRIENRPGEGGRCGRHATAWTGRWITRRPSWADDSCERTLYFRKTFSLDSAPRRADLCIAAVNRCVVYVNGRRVHSGAGWRIPATVPIGTYLTTGTNLVAVAVENDNPLPGKNALEAETFDPDSLTSLLAEIAVETDSGTVVIGTDDSWICRSRFGDGWQEPAAPEPAAPEPAAPEPAAPGPEASAVRVDVAAIAFPWGREEGDRWIYAWSRGAPPLLPWGPLPHFGKDLPWPLELEYRIVLPRGTARVYRPPVRGEVRFTLDGRDIGREFEASGYADLPGDAADRAELRIGIVAAGPEDGLSAPVSVAATTGSFGLVDWRSLGWEYHSGEAEYRTNFVLPELEGRRCELDLGDVRFHAEVFANGVNCGSRIWQPYRYDLSGAVRTGVNELRVVVSNLAAPAMAGALLDEGRALGWNRYWYGENIERDAENLRSGLFGPVRILLTP